MLSKRVWGWITLLMIIASCRKEHSQEAVELAHIDSGTITVWTKHICSGSDKIVVRIGNDTKELTEVFAEQPGCGAAGTASFSLAYGNYMVEASCGDNKIQTEVDLNADCLFLQAEFQDAPAQIDYLPLTETSFWEYSSHQDPSVSQVLTANGIQEIGGTNYTRLISSRGNTYYYRKEPPNYYQYRTLSFQDFIENPPSIELIILKENLQKGEKWETEPVDLEISGIVQKVKLVSTIVNRDYSDTFNGVQYNDLIKVQTEIFFSPDGSGYATSGSAFNTVFSKGYGIVDYSDWDINIQWGIKNLSVQP